MVRSATDNTDTVRKFLGSYAKFGRQNWTQWQKHDYIGSLGHTNPREWDLWVKMPSSPVAD